MPVLFYIRYYEDSEAFGYWPNGKPTLDQANYIVDAIHIIKDQVERMRQEWQKKSKLK